MSLLFDHVAKVVHKRGIKLCSGSVFDFVKRLADAERFFSVDLAADHVVPSFHNVQNSSGKGNFVLLAPVRISLSIITLVMRRNGNKIELKWGVCF